MGATQPRACQQASRVQPWPPSRFHFSGGGARADAPRVLHKEGEALQTMSFVPCLAMVQSGQHIQSEP